MVMNCPLEAAPSSDAGDAWRPCEAEGSDDRKFSRSKRRRLRDRKVAVRQAFVHSSILKNQISVNNCVDERIEARVQTEIPSADSETLCLIARKLEGMEQKLWQLAYYLNFSQYQAHDADISAGTHHADIALSCVRPGAKPFMPAGGDGLRHPRVEMSPNAAEFIPARTQLISLDSLISVSGSQSNMAQASVDSDSNSYSQDVMKMASGTISYSAATDVISYCEKEDDEQDGDEFALVVKPLLGATPLETTKVSDALDMEMRPNEVEIEACSNDVAKPGPESSRQLKRLAGIDAKDEADEEENDHGEDEPEHEEENVEDPAEVVPAIHIDVGLAPAEYTQLLNGLTLKQYYFRRSLPLTAQDVMVSTQENIETQTPAVYECGETCICGRTFHFCDDGRGRECFDCGEVVVALSRIMYCCTCDVTICAACYD